MRLGGSKRTGQRPGDRVGPNGVTEAVVPEPGCRNRTTTLQSDQRFGRVFREDERATNGRRATDVRSLATSARQIGVGQQCDGLLVPTFADRLSQRRSRGLTTTGHKQQSAAEVDHPDSATVFDPPPMAGLGRETHLAPSDTRTFAVALTRALSIPNELVGPRTIKGATT